MRNSGTVQYLLRVEAGNRSPGVELQGLSQGCTLHVGQGCMLENYIGMTGTETEARQVAPAQCFRCLVSGGHPCIRLHTGTVCWCVPG